ncbi:hypothetical protein RZE82_08715 [Mollicutes bacterium LVI A0039]|nr:hypothetical protein RZE82_08715 [Mollicutes bacterium LVI A0039]
MKKMLNIIISLSLMISTAYVLIYSCFRYDITPFLNDNIIIIEKGSDLSSTEYIDILSEASDEYDVFPLFSETDIGLNTKYEITYYTDYKGNLPSDYPRLFSTSSTVPFSDITKFNLNTIQVGLLGNEENFIDFGSFLESSGLEITESNYTTESYFKQYNYMMFLVLFSFNIMYMYIFIATKKKKYAILKLEGFKASDSMLWEIKEFFGVSIFYAILLLMFAIALSVTYELSFALFFIRNELLVMIGYIIFIIISLFMVQYNFKKIKVSNIKNNIINPSQPLILMVLTIGVTYLFLNVTIELFDTFNHYQDTNEKYSNVSALYEYSTAPIYSNISDVNYSEKYSDISTALYNFYFLTQSDLDGTLVSYSEYDQGMMFNVNGNYLDKQEVLDNENNIIKPSDLPIGITRLIPESNVGSVSSDNSVIIKDDQALKYIDNNSGDIVTTEDYLFIDVVNYTNMKQVLESANPDLVENALIAPMSIEHYYIKTNKDDPNAVTESYVQKADAENYIRQTPLIGNQLLKSLMVQKRKVAAYTVLFIMLVIMEGILIINSNLTLLLTMRKKLSIYYIGDLSLPKSIIAIIGVNTGLFMLLGLILYLITSSTISLILTLMICLLHITSFITLYKSKIIKNISNNIKGDV